MYKRILLKISGEQLALEGEHGMNPDRISWIAHEIKKVVEHNIEVVIIVGGGNLARGVQIQGHGIKRVTADQIGMLATMMNGLALNDILESINVQSRCLSNIFAEQVAEPFIHRLAEKHLERGRVVIVAGGIGRPYLTTDTAAVSLALEMSCDVVLKATKVDGIYDSDPNINPMAKKFKRISSSKAVSDPAIKVMDKAAMGLAYEFKLPIIVFDALVENNILNAASGSHSGTIIED